MINFIIYEDQKLFVSKIENVINESMKKRNNEYKIQSFDSYNKSFSSIIEKEMASKIYILDIEIPNSISGIDIARKIRKKDWDSIIIIVTSHVELSYEALKAQIMLLDFVCKQNNCSGNLLKTINKAVNKINDKKVLVFESNGIVNRVYTDDILYIKKDSVDRKCIIKTTYNSILVNKNLNDFIDMLDTRFYVSHRSCLINTEKIKSINWKNSIIIFNNNESIDYLSRDRKKGLKEYVK